VTKLREKNQISWMVGIQPSCWWSAALGGLQRRFLVRDGGDRVLLREKGEIEKKKNQ
jgi:hypothetical protein